MTRSVNRSAAARRTSSASHRSLHSAARLLVTSMAESKPKPTRAMLPAVNPAASATAHSAEFHAIVRYWKIRPWRAASVRCSPIARVTVGAVQIATQQARYREPPSIIVPYFIIPSPIAFGISPRVCVIRGESDSPPIIPIIGHMPPSMCRWPCSGPGWAGSAAAREQLLKPVRSQAPGSLLSTLTRNYGDVSTDRSCGCGQAMLGSELGQERSKILAGEGPLERGRRSFVVILEAEQAVLDLGQRGEVVRRQDLALDDREIDLDLVEPAGMDRRVDEDEAGPGGAQPRPRALAAVGGPVVDDPKHPARRPVGLLGHHLRDEATEGRDARRRLAPAEHLTAIMSRGALVAWH